MKIESMTLLAETKYETIKSIYKLYKSMPESEYRNKLVDEMSKLDDPRRYLVNGNLACTGIPDGFGGSVQRTFEDRERWQKAESLKSCQADRHSN